MRRALFVAALLAAFVLPQPAAAGPSSAQELREVRRALGQICDWIQLSRSIGSEVEAATNLIKKLDVKARTSKKKSFFGRLSKNATSNDKAARARRSVERALKKLRDLEAERPFTVNGRKRRVDHMYRRILIELKHAARISSRDIRQFSDYLTKARDGHLVVAIRRGAKVSRTKALRLARMMRNRRLVLLSCAF
jgi:hypothetical protein